MKRLQGALIILTGLILLVILSASCMQQQETTIVEESEPLCKPETMEDIDFRVLNTASRPALEEHSVAWDMLDLGENEELIAHNATTHFLNALNVPLSNIPEWFREMQEEAVSLAEENNEPVDYGFLNTAYERFIEDLRYSHYADPEQKFKLFKAVNEGFIQATGDPFAQYIPPSATKDWIEGLTGTYFGISSGISLNSNNEWELSPFGDNNPARKAGIESRDILRKVNGKSVAGCLIRDIVDHIKGPEGTVVNLTLERNRELLEISVTRDKVKEELLSAWPPFDWPDGRGNSAKSLKYQFPLQNRHGEEVPDVAYIKLLGFELQPTRDFHYALQQMPWEDLSGLIVDLTHNPGGLLVSGTAMTGYFLSENAVLFYERSADGRVTIHRNPPKAYYNAIPDLDFAPNLIPPDIPVVILVTKYSASASELFSAALQDYKRAVVVGERTWGKGTVNNNFPLEGGKYGTLYIAIRLWESPNHRFIEPLHETEEGGILPDVVVEQPPRGFNPDNDENIFKALEILKQEKKE